MKEISCKTCCGRGGDLNCPQCWGLRIISSYTEFGEDYREETCDSCDGRECDNCGGSGIDWEEDTAPSNTDLSDRS